MTVDGLNLTMQVNYYSPFLLTHLLIDLMKNSSSARLIFCSSPIVSVFANLFCFGKTVNKIFGDYRISKFCVLVIADMFAEKLKCYRITSNSFHPGGVNTQIHKQFCRHRVLKYLHDILGPWVFKTPEDGAQTAIYLACANEVQNVSGRFFADLVSICKPKQLENQRLCETIWEKSEKVVKLKKDELI
ncbi:unnamed protein product [Psylliodes chrysocephalus]|uniref:Uncharacterized protein n=1 Tax=Psylliodes chrysocephalus TaxID=3402493 RepID=A0A9P0GFS6_9CUCU|nr:unnamed protein product [Psylliodes chrysocephala]